jgi:hypothetical protein
MATEAELLGQVKGVQPLRPGHTRKSPGEGRIMAETPMSAKGAAFV